MAGDDLAHFDQPTDLAFASNGEIFSSEGRGNGRVVRIYVGDRIDQRVEVFDREGHPIAT